MDALIIEPIGKKHSAHFNDDLGNRRELWFQVFALNRATRLRLLRCCVNEWNRLEWRRSFGRSAVQSRIRDTTSGEPAEIYWDLCRLMFDGLPIEFVMEAVAAHRRHPIPDDPADSVRSCKWQ